MVSSMVFFVVMWLFVTLNEKHYPKLICFGMGYSGMAVLFDLFAP